MPPALPKPNPPQLADADARGSDYLRISWAPLPGVAGYRIRCNTAEQAHAGTVNESEFKSLSPNSEHLVSLNYVMGGEESEWSDTLHVFTRPPKPGPARLVLGEQSRGPDYFVLEWDLLSDQAVYNYKYDVEFDDLEDGGFPDKPVVGDKKPGNRFDKLSNAPGREVSLNMQYAVRIRARDDLRGGESFFSDPFTVWSRPPTPSAPALVNSDTGRGPDYLELTWPLAPGHTPFQYAYDVFFDDVDDVDFASEIRMGNQSPGSKFDVISVEPPKRLQPNVEYRVWLEVRDDARGGKSFPSVAPLVVVTRPATPSSPHLTGAYIQRVLCSWGKIPDFHKSAGCVVHVGLRKGGAGGIELLTQGGLQSGGTESVMFNSYFEEWEFLLRIVDPSRTPPNESFWSRGRSIKLSDMRAETDWPNRELTRATTQLTRLCRRFHRI